MYRLDANEKGVISAIVPMPALRLDAPAITSLLNGNFPQLREILVVEGRSPASQRNEGARMSVGSLLYFLDDDAEVLPETIGAGLRALADPEVAAVGGPAITRPAAGVVERVIGDILESPYGAGSTQGRNLPLGSAARTTTGEDLHLCNLIVRRSVFEACGGLKGNAYPGEDPELVRRLLREGRKLVYEPRMLVRRPRRRSVPAFSRQMFRYGSARAMHAFSLSSAKDALFTLPSILLLYFATLFVGGASSIGSIRLLPLACYVSFLVGGAIHALGTGIPPPRAIGALALYPIMHLSYGAGFLVGAAVRLFPAPFRFFSKPETANPRWRLSENN